MIAALIVAALILLPGTTAAQSPATLTDKIEIGTTPGAPAGEIDLRSPPPPTIPSSPVIPLPSLAPSGARPRTLFTVQPAASLVEEWTDNFTRSPDEARANFRSAFSPGVVVLLDDPTLTGQGSYTPRIFYDTLPADIGIHHTLAGQLRWAVTPRVSLNTSAVMVQTDDPERADRLGLRRGREKFTSTTGTFGIDYVLPLSRVTGSYRHAMFDSTDQTTTSQTIGGSAAVTIARSNTLTGAYEYLASRSESGSEATTATPGTAGTTGDSTTRGHQFTASLSRDLSPDAVAGLSSSYALRDRTGGSAGDSSFSRWSLSAFNNWALPDKIVLQGNSGISHISPSSGESRFLWTTSSNVSYSLGPAVMGVGIESGISETFSDGQDAGIVETSGITASFSYRFTPLLFASANGGYRENTFTGDDGGSSTGREEKTTTLSVRATYQVLRWLTSTLEYAYTKTRSSEADRGYIENRVQATLSAIFY